MIEIMNPLYSENNRIYQNYYFEIENDTRAYVPYIFHSESIIFLGGNNGTYYGLPCYLQVESVSNEKEKKAVTQFVLGCHFNGQLKLDGWGKSAHEIILKLGLLLNKNVSCKFSIQILLENTEKKLFQDVRKSYKSLINRQNRERNTFILYGQDSSKSIWLDFKRLHFLDAGRSTRPDDTWDEQFRNISSEKAFLVAQYYDGSIVSGGYFLLSNEQVYYGVSASMPQDDGSRIGSHAVLFNAILFSKKIGKKIFISGCDYVSSVTPKVTSILNYKSGFGGVFNIVLSLS